eukprot:XP_003727540.2 PREDICTED: galectin-3-binding protein isoform X2 [Strongylocentrotus purpuratus]
MPLINMFKKNIYSNIIAHAPFISIFTSVSTAVPQENDIRLVTTETTTTRLGRVEVFHGGRWGSVCDQGFEMEDAKVVCRQWGYPAGVYSLRYLESKYGQGRGPIMLSNVRCTGTEAKLTDCPADPWEQNQCTRDQEVGVMCRGTRTEQTKAARELYDMIEQLEEAYAEKEEAYAEKEEDFFQTLKEEDEAYQEKKELELVAEILAQLEDN